MKVRAPLVTPEPNGMTLPDVTAIPLTATEAVGFVGVTVSMVTAIGSAVAEFTVDAPTRTDSTAVIDQVPSTASGRSQ